MALPAGQEADHPHHHQQPGAVDSRLFKGPNALFNQRASGKAVPKHDHTQRSFLIMFPAWLFGMAVFATQILWQRSEIGLLQFSNLPDTSDGEAVVISSSAVSALLLFYLLGLLTFYVTPSFFRPDDKTVWSAASAGFGAASFSGDKLPSWADEIVHAVGGARAIMPGLAVAYAFGSLVYLFLVGTTSIVAELAGPDFMHKHHHIYRPMILKAWVSWMAYNVGICVSLLSLAEPESEPEHGMIYMQIAALMVPWTMEAALDSYNDENNTKVKMEICAGISMLLIALFLHLIALTTGFHLIAKQRMQLRHPGWVRLRMVFIPTMQGLTSRLNRLLLCTNTARNKLMN